jgi:hypothetical protein
MSRLFTGLRNGDARVEVLPRPWGLVTSSAAWWASAMVLHIARPRPGQTALLANFGLRELPEIQRFGPVFQ